MHKQGGAGPHTARRRVPRFMIGSHIETRVRRRVRRGGRNAMTKTIDLHVYRSVFDMIYNKGYPHVQYTQITLYMRMRMQGGGPGGVWVRTFRF